MFFVEFPHFNACFHYFKAGLPNAANTAAGIRIPNSQDSVDSGLGNDIVSSLALQPPPMSGGKPVFIKRGPGRPRKDSSNSGKHQKGGEKKKISGYFFIVMLTC